jgi:hypothetical protein
MKNGKAPNLATAVRCWIATPSVTHQVCRLCFVARVWLELHAGLAKMMAGTHSIYSE